MTACVLTRVPPPLPDFRVRKSFSILHYPILQLRGSTTETSFQLGESGVFFFVAARSSSSYFCSTASRLHPVVILTVDDNGQLDSHDFRNQESAGK